MRDPLAEIVIPASQNSALAKIEERARALQKANHGMTYAQAYKETLEADPGLYTEFLALRPLELAKAIFGPQSRR